MLEESTDTVFKDLLERWESESIGLDGELSTDLDASDRRRAEEKKEWEARWANAIGDHE